MLPDVEFLRSAEQIEQVRSGLPHRRPLLWLVRFDGLHIERTRHMFAAPQFNTGVYPGRLAGLTSCTHAVATSMKRKNGKC